MKIKDRLALYFTIVSSLMLAAVLAAIYFFFIRSLQNQFFERLTDRTMVSAKLYLEADEISSDSLAKVRTQYLEKLHSEEVRIYDSKNKASFTDHLHQPQWSDDVINKIRKSGFMRFHTGERQAVGIFYKDNQGDFVIIASAVDQSSHSRVKELLRIMFMVFLCMAVGILACARWLSRKMLQPLDFFIEEVSHVQSNNLSFRVKTSPQNDEIQLLAGNFNQLMEDLEQAFILQKTFVASASHELRTPLTRMVMAAEISLSKERAATSYRETLSSILEDAEALEQTFQSLVALAQSDIDQANAPIEPLAVQPWLKEQINKWAAQYALFYEEEAALRPENPPLINVNQKLLHMALENLISNASKFSQKAPVLCQMTVEDSEVVIAIRDKGIGIDKQETKRIFQPFIRLSSDATYEGSGMGLYITSKIIARYKGYILVESEPGKGSTFTIRLPLLNPG